MLRAYIVDDERLAVERLARLLEGTGRVRIVGRETDPENAIVALSTADVDVLFLDIQMPGMDGFELLERLGRDIQVVFTTAYDRYALDAFTVNSVDYLLKPVEPERLDQTIDKLERLGRSAIADVRGLARALAAELGPGRRLERVASRVGEKTTILDVAGVSHFVSRDKLTFAVAKGREHVIGGSLGELEARLDPRRFVRIHRATIVNTTFVQEIYPGMDTARRRSRDGDAEPRGGAIVRLKDEARTELTVARDRVRTLKERLGIS